MAMLSPVEIDIGRKVASCSWKQFGSIIPDGWSDSDSDFEKENDAKAVDLDTKRLSLSVVTQNILKGLKQKISRGLRSQILP